MTIYYCDIEADGFLEDATKVHCISWITNIGNKPLTITGDIKSFFSIPIPGDTLVWHNGTGYDLPLLKKLGIIDSYNFLTSQVNDKDIQLIDSLALSRFWWPENPKGHGLDAWANKLNTFKPEVDDWHNLPLEVYVDRCENDVITTKKVFEFLADKMEVEL